MGAGWQRVLDVTMTEFAGCVPEAWRVAILWAAYDNEHLSCVITDAEGKKWITPTPWLNSLVDDLHTKMARHGHEWKVAKLNLFLNEIDEEVEFSVIGTARSKQDRITLAEVVMTKCLS